MQRASVRERPFQALGRHSAKTSKPTLRVIDGGQSFLPDWLELLGLLLFIFAHRKKKTGIVAIPRDEAEPAFFDEVPDTGVHEIAAYAPILASSDGVVTNDRLDEIIRDAAPVPALRFPISGEKPKPAARKRAEPKVEEDPFPRKVSSHALGQFARAYLKARGKLGQFIDRRIEDRIGRRKASELDYKDRLRLRRVERKAMADQLLRIARDEGRILRENQERIASGIDIIHIARGPSKSYFARFDPKSGVILGFYSAEGFNRHKAYRRARRKSRGEGRRVH